LARKNTPAKKSAKKTIDGCDVIGYNCAPLPGVAVEEFPSPGQKKGKKSIDGWGWIG